MKMFKAILPIFIVSFLITGCASENPTLDPVGMQSVVRNIFLNTSTPFWKDKQGMEFMVSVYKADSGEKGINSEVRGLYTIDASQKNAELSLYDPAKTPQSARAAKISKDTTQIAICTQNQDKRTCESVLSKDFSYLIFDAANILFAISPDMKDSFVVESSGTGSAAAPKTVYVVRKINKQFLGKEIKYSVATSLGGFPMRAYADNWKIEFISSKSGEIDHIKYIQDNSPWIVELKLELERVTSLDK